MTETAVIRVGGYTRTQLAKTIDHALLQPQLTEADVLAGCAMAKAYDVASVCVRPYDVPVAVHALAGTTVAVGTVIGFPHASTTTRAKAFEAEDALANGATELDMVLNIGQLRSGHEEAVRDDIAAVVGIAMGRALVKVIFENAYLSDEHKILACRLVAEAGGDFVKTSTGFAPTGATIQDLELMRANTPPGIQVKAAGGVRTLDALLAALDAGATRVGASATNVILDDFDARARSGDTSSAGGVLQDGY